MLIVSILTACVSPDSSKIINNMKALEGNWSSYKGVEFNENWHYVNDSTLNGEGFSLVDGDTAFYESLKILRTGDTICYRVNLGEADKFVYFKLRKSSKNSWLFVNPDNEFPKKISYKIRDNQYLDIVISDMEVNKKQEFYLQKQ